jgi:hypothetical protein
MTKLISVLSGGLGNQLFQYATARALASENSVELVLDNWSGFIRDFEYKRTFELGSLPTSGRVASALERLPIWFYRITNRITKSKKRFYEKRWFGNFLLENEMRFDPRLISLNISSPTWMVGYWQCPRYFESYSSVLRVELMPPKPMGNKFLELGKKIKESNSVAVGVRLYEESRNPGAHCRGGVIKHTLEIRDAIDRVLSCNSDAKCFVFCTHRTPLFDELGLPASVIYVTPNEGFEGAIETLWLLSQCRHHIFTNSSYYWWGAWLSKAIRGDEGQRILAANNFINEDSLDETWETF